MKFFEAKKFKIAFPNYDSKREFEYAIGVHERIYKETIIDGAIKDFDYFEDGRIEITYPVKWNRVKNFMRVIRAQDRYSTIYGDKYRITNWERV